MFCNRLESFMLKTKQDFEKTMEALKGTDIKRGITELWENLQCPICLDVMITPVSTKCDHLFCKFCMMKLLESKKQNRADCPVCKAKITKRSLQESPGFQRLVTGLQLMVQAYEQDSSLTDVSSRSTQQQPSVTAQQPDSGSNGDVSDPELGDAENTNQNNLPPSHSSTIAAQHGFARLMGLEDLSPLTTGNEGLDSGLGDAPPDSERIMLSSSTGYLETIETEVSEPKTSVTQCENASTSPEKEDPPPLRKSTRKKKKKDSEPDDVLNKKQKSLEKVAKWLMQVPLTEEDMDLEKPAKDPFDSNNSDSGSSTSTIDIRQHSVPKRAERAGALAEQVFGAVYKRKRRGNQTTAGPLKVCVDPQMHSLSEDALTVKEAAGQKKDDLQESLCDDRNDSDVEDELQVTEQVNISGEEMQQMDTELNGGNDEVDCASSDPEPRRPGRKSKKTLDALHLVDSDLQEQAKAELESPERKKAVKKKGKNARQTRGKSARVSKPLVLVAAQNGAHSPGGAQETKATSEETHVLIENYPSSEDRGTPVLMSGRRSRRLQHFTAEVQEGRTKAQAPANRKIDAPAKDSGVVKVKKTDEQAHKKGNVTKAAKRNGCVFDQDIGGIEDLESGERKAGAVQESDGGDPNVEAPSEADAAVPAQESDAHSETRENNVNDVGMEEDRNDSELDTEQLLRSFKTTKRKSFHLGGPKVKMNSLDEEKRNCHVGSGAKDRRRTKESDVTNQELKDNDNSCCSDLIPPSNSSRLNPETVLKESDQALVEDAIIPDTRRSGQDSASNRVSTALSPNKASKQQTGSPHLSLAPQAVDSALRLTVVGLSECEQDGPNEADDQLDCAQGKMKHINDDITPGNSASAMRYSSADDLANAESSLTQSGLLAELAPKATASGEVSAQSPIKSNAQKKRRAQRLQSSSESSGGQEEELPSFSQILRAAASVPDLVQDEECPNRTSAACPSLDCFDASQMSVDLFSTPQESNIPVNDNSVPMESSQFSSGILVTQQKMEMQKELVRLEKLMALVSEVLQEKEDDPAKRVPSESHQSGGNTGRDAPRSPPCDPGTGQTSGRNAGPGAGRGLSDGECVTRPCLSKRSTDADTGLRAEGCRVPRTPSSSTATMPTSKAPNAEGSPSDGQEDKENNVKPAALAYTPPRDGGKAKLVLVSSGLAPSEQVLVKKFAKRVGAHVIPHVTADATHIIMRTDGTLVCERTLKYFLGIAGRKWVVSFHWISECFKQKKLLDESPFEVRGDVVNGPDHHGPMRARTTKDNNLLMKGYKICFQGPFMDMTTGELEWMVELCGAAVVKDPLLLDSKQKSHQLVIVQPGPDSSLSRYNSLCRKATVVTRGWLLDTVATYTLQNYNNYNHAK
ncbi:uncharacterized protein LOC143001978 isoform X2 [Genypterus blacodes]|uniref:uncharacterized protein LOC143001978 isoform X2 n=1 Tax=Genypterus blacodes TaxID=154954 RepID=UPI003F7719CA